MLSRSLVACAVTALTVGALSGCSSDTDTGAAASTSASAVACPITLSDAWVKAADSGMTAGFGAVSNPSSDEVTIVAASSPAATTMELHEVVDADGSMIMRPIEGGFLVPAQGTQVLEPGGYHLMLMDIPAPIEPGADVVITLTCSTGGTVTITAPAKTFAGADEEYAGEGGMLGSTPTPSS